MAIRYEIDVSLRTSEGAQLPPALLKRTVDELEGEFGLISTSSIYRPVFEKLSHNEHQEWIRFSFDTPESSETHEAVARWLVTVAKPRFGDSQLLVAWYHPASYLS